MVNACTEEAAACGLESWLYDEDKWPSGTASGVVTANPEYRMKFIYLETFAGDAFDFESWASAVDRNAAQRLSPQLSLPAGACRADRCHFRG